MFIQSNIEGMQTYLNFSKIDSAFNKSLNKISSGMDLSKPSDGAGMFATAADMENLYQEYTTGSKNVQDAAGFLEVATTVMTEVNGLMGKMNELAQRAATGTYTNAQRAEMNQEYRRLRSNINIVLSNARYNDVSLFGVGHNSRSVMIVYGENKNMTVSTRSMSLANLKISSASSISTRALASGAVGSLASGLNYMDRTLAFVGAEIEGLQSKVNILNDQALQEKSFESRINELDFAKEMKNFTSLQVVMQASNAMLAQSNNKAQMILSLFK
jgi:flagellin